jgi:phosphatidylethanolamine/phosphatidyl-N-methylethanolamine N-methyltransferase
MRGIYYDEMNTEYLTFIRELPKSFPQIGAMLPSSAALGRAMVRPIREATRPLNILEVGPGTGPFTRQILKLMRSEDRFTICEINPRFLALLKKKLESHPNYHQHKDRIRFFQGPVQDLPQSSRDGDGAAEKYDMIVSSLPFSNFTPDTVNEILSLFRTMTAENGTVTFCEYLGMRKLSAVLSSRRGKERLAGVDEVIQRWVDMVEESGEVKKKLAILNVPPAFAIRFDYNRLV